MKYFVAIFLLPIALFSQGIDKITPFGQWSLTASRYFSARDTSGQNISLATTWTDVTWIALDTIQTGADPSAATTTIRLKHPGIYTVTVGYDLYNTNIATAAIVEMRMLKQDTTVQGSHQIMTLSGQEYGHLTSTFKVRVTTSDTSDFTEADGWKGWATCKFQVFSDQTGVQISAKSNFIGSAFNPTSKQVFIKWEGY